MRKQCEQMTNSQSEEVISPKNVEHQIQLNREYLGIIGHNIMNKWQDTKINMKKENIKPNW